MSYTVLARKYRPRSFHELVGQNHVKSALINSLESGRVHHAYLFAGTRGVGKTTIARILAKCLNCESFDEMTSKPCETCSACTEINEGRFVDLLEIDAASRTKVEDTRDMLDNVQYAPTRGRYKVYLIDEVHMLSTHSFNALLKTLEEPPEHVKFLLATTDPQKLPITVLSRCLQFNLRKMTPAEIVDHLSNTLTSESINFELEALWHLARGADGSMRDAMSLTDQAIVFGGDQLSEAAVREMLGVVESRQISVLLDAIIANDGQQLMTAAQALAENAPDYNLVNQELLRLIHEIAVYQRLPTASDESDQLHKEKIATYAQSIPAEALQLYYQIALQGQQDIQRALDAQIAFEMVLLRMLAFKPMGFEAAKTHIPVDSSSVNSNPVNKNMDQNRPVDRVSDTESVAQEEAPPEKKSMMEPTS